MALLVLSLAAAAYMAGVSWLVSLVVYPAFLLAGEGPDWARYHDQHTRRITPVVLPGMVVELVTSGWIALAAPVDAVPPALAWIGFALALGTWGLTGLVAVPDHGRLERGYDAQVARRLLRNHHLRTVAWTAHLVVAAAVLLAATGSP